MQSNNFATKSKSLSIKITSVQPSVAWFICIIGAISPFITLFAPLFLAPLFIIGSIIPTIFIIKKQGLRFILKSNIYLTAYTYLIFGVISATWAITPKETLNMSLRLGLILLCSACMFEFITGLEREKRILMAKFLLIGVIIGLATANFEILSNGLISRLIKGANPKKIYELTDLNRGSSYLAIVFWPCFAYLLLQERRVFAIILFAASFITSLHLESQSAPVAIAIGIVAFLFIRITGRKGINIIMVLAVLAIPAIAITAKIMDPAKMFQTLPNIPNSASEYRLYIWDYAAEKAYQKPWLGWGFNSARSFPVKESEYVLGGRHPLPLHTHNNILQIWLESGIAGLVIFAVFILSVFHRIKTVRTFYIPDSITKAQNNLTMSLFIGMLVTYFVIGAIGYGVWQNWWLASILIATWFMLGLCKD